MDDTQNNLKFEISIKDLTAFLKQIKASKLAKGMNYSDNFADCINFTITDTDKASIVASNLNQQIDIDLSINVLNLPNDEGLYKFAIDSSRLLKICDALNNRKSVKANIITFTLTHAGRVLNIKDPDGDVFDLQTFTDGMLDSMIDNFNNTGSGFFSMTASKLLDVLMSVEGFMSDEETRYYLNGIYIHKHVDDENEIRFVATDGHRLVFLATAPQSMNSISSDGVIIPKEFVYNTIHQLKALLKIEKAYNKEHGSELEFMATVKFDGDLSKVIMTIESPVNSINSSRQVSKLVDGTFPDYERVIPSDNHGSVSIEKKEFLEVMKTALSMASERMHGIKLSSLNGVASIGAVNPACGSYEKVLKNSQVSNIDDFEVGLNANYLSDIVTAFDSDGGVFKIADSACPVLYTPNGYDESKVLMVLMHMRV